MGPVSGQLSYPLDLVALEREGATPLHLQLSDQLRNLILNGDIRAQIAAAVDPHDRAGARVSPATPC